MSQRKSWQKGDFRPGSRARDPRWYDASSCHQRAVVPERPNHLKKVYAGGLLGLLLLLATFPRLLGLGQRGLWLDEAYSALLAQSSVGRILEMLRADSGPPLYYLFLHLWCRIFGTGEFALRLPSALAGAASVLVCFAVGRRLGLGRASAFAAILTALSPLLVHHSQEVRYYAVLPLIGGTALLTLDRLLTRPGRLRWFLYTVTLVCAEYTHNYGLLLVPAATAYALVRRGPRARLRELHAAHAMALVFYLPWIPSLIAQIRFGGTAWLERFFGILTPLHGLEAFIPAGNLPPYLGIVDIGLPRLLAPLPILGSAVALAVAFRRRAELRSAVLSILAFTLAPALIVYVYSLALRPIYLVGRGDILFFPAFALLVGMGIAALRPRWAQAAAAAVLLLPAVMTLAAQYRTDSKSGDRTVARFIHTRAHAGDVIVCTGLTYATAEYYLERWGNRAWRLSFPVEMREHPGNLSLEKTLHDPRQAIGNLVAELEDALRGAGPETRVWVIFTPGPLWRRLEPVLSQILQAGEAIDLGERMGNMAVPIRLRQYHVVERGSG